MRLFALLLTLTGMMFLSSPLSSQNVVGGVDDATGLEVGTPAPFFEAVDQDGKAFSLGEALEKGPVVLIFYRGQWCPVCNRHLSYLQDSLDMILSRGASVVAVSPEKPEYLEVMATKTGASFTLLYDEGYRIAEAYGVLFDPTGLQRFAYNFIGANLDEAHGNDEELLPIPATYILEPDGLIGWRQFDPNYKIRASVADILHYLDNRK